METKFNNVKQIVHEANMDIASGLAKSGLGAAGTITATMINTWIGILAGLLTCIFMVFQIEGAWRKRKIAIEKIKELEDELQD